MIAPIDLSSLQSESRNPNTLNIDTVSTFELCQIINQEDSQVANAVQKCLPVVAAAIDALATRVRQGGKVVYVGAGTSGRLGVLDASELPPTFSANPEQFVAIIAGGDNALRHAQEGAEDDEQQAVKDLQNLQLDGKKDALIGIAASGRTPYVLSCMQYAKALGCVTVGVACSSPSAMSRSGDVDHMIEAVTAGEVVTGSTRLKAGTATKMVLNMLSTGVMIKNGKTFGNMMVDLKATNLKLKQRARNILRQICGPLCPRNDDEIDILLKECDGSVKLAIASASLQLPVSEAKVALENAGGVLAVALDQATKQLNGKKSHPDTSVPEFVLFVDGGGSKCAAAIVDASGQMKIGLAGGCNATEVGPQAATDTIISAINRTLAEFPVVKGLTLDQVKFSRIWIGMAGYDRSKIAQQMNTLLEQAFSRKISPNFRVGNDIEGIATSAAEGTGVPNATVLIAGTGSVAMTYSKDSNTFHRKRRVGGYGHLLGDEGSAFDIGRRAIKHALDEIDEINEEDCSERNVQTLTTLTKMVMKHFAVDLPKASDLLGAVLSSGDGSVSTYEAKRRIADVARTVLDASRTCEAADLIISSAVVSLTSLASKATKPTHLDLSQSVLVLTGGLMQNEPFRSRVIAAISDAGMRFGKTDYIQQPAVFGAQHLYRSVTER